MDRRAFNRTVGVIGAGMLTGLGSNDLSGRESGSASSEVRTGGSPPDRVLRRQAGEFDVDRARRETPGCSRVTHFNNAGSSLPPQPVLDAVVGHLKLEGEIGGYEAADAARSLRNNTYAAISRLLNCSTEEIALVENATRGWDMAFYSMSFKPGDRILTCSAEYGSNYIAYLQVAKRTGAVIEVIPDDEHGQLSLDSLRNELRRGGVALVGITHVPTNGGLVNPAEEIGALTREAGVPYLLDACQSAGQWPLDVEKIGCDMLSVTGRKFLRGPRGTGFLYVRREMIPHLEPPFLDLHAATWTKLDEYEIDPTARRFENWESYIAGGIGLGVAVDYALDWGIESIQSRVIGLADRLRASLDEVPGVTVRDLGQDRCGIVTFTHAGATATALKDHLRQKQINVSVTSRSSTRIDMESRGLESMVRASVHYFNTEEELDRLVEELREV
ncbi:MAG: aminotransferase class V-fold PLP-dependent enzyme [Gemmatimonadota bacterium]